MGILFGDTYNTYTTEVREVTKQINHGPITVTENRAPTDESVKILMEMHDKVLKNIIATIKSDDNIFHCSGMCYKDAMLNAIIIVTKYTINKQERVVKTSLDWFALKDIVTCLERIKQDIAMDVAQLIVGQSALSYYDELLWTIHKKGF